VPQSSRDQQPIAAFKAMTHTIARLCLLLSVGFLFQSVVAYTSAADDDLPTITLSDFSSTLPPEWLSAQARNHWKGIFQDCTTQQPCYKRDAAITKRLMDIYSWKAFVAVNWPTDDKVDDQAEKRGWFVESSGATLAEAIDNGVKSLGESEDNVLVELMSDGPPYKVGITRCRAKPEGSGWYPPNGSVWAVSKTVDFPSQNQISAANCPRWMTWHTRRDTLGLAGLQPTRRTFCENNPQSQQNSLSIFTLTDFNRLTSSQLSGMFQSKVLGLTQSEVVRFIQSDFPSLGQSQVPGLMDEPLVDQNGQKVYYNISVNDVSYCTLKEAARQGLNIMTFPPGRSEESDVPGSTELKFAWKVLSPEDDSSRFITWHVRVPDPEDPNNLTWDCDATPDKCTWKKATVGLVGIHIVHKSKLHMEWIWSTFEQIDNSPDESSLQTVQLQGRKFSFYGSRVLHNALAPTQLTRTQPIAPDTDQLNREARHLLQQQHSVLQYYELVGTQYDPLNRADIAQAISSAVPQVLRNTVIEPYIPQGSSCIGCHSTAKLNQSCCRSSDCESDFSFLASGLNCSLATLTTPTASATPSTK
jgi:hypothetical protein